MSWIRPLGWLALTIMLIARGSFAQQPQLAPPQYGLAEQQPRGYPDNGPQPTLAAPQTNDDSREYLRLLNQPVGNNPAPALNNSPPAPVNNAPVNVATRAEPQPAAPNNLPQTQPNIQATYQQPITATTSPLAPANIAPPGNNVPRTVNASGAKSMPLAGPNTKTPAATGGWGSFGTMLGSLAIVLALFVVTIKLLRRGIPGAKQRLARDVVEVLGQTPLANRQSLQVIRFGNKILLVAISPEGCDTLTEITDPLEVDRLAGMCHQSQANSSTKTFGEMFRQVTSIRPATNDTIAEASPTTPALDEVRARLRGGSLVNTREVPHG